MYLISGISGVVKRVSTVYGLGSFVLALGVLLSAYPDDTSPLIRLPGTQPGQVAPADSFQQCVTCHEDIVRQWQGSPKAHAPRDPVFNALLAITNKKTIPLGLDVGEYCLRCHSPSGWLAGRSHELSVQSLYGTDLDGVHCDFCHRAVDPLRPPPDAEVTGTVPGYGNGMYVVMPEGEPRRGTRNAVPYGHPVFREPFLKTSEFCGVCHEVSNPYFASDPFAVSPHLQPPLERTYSEWKLSWYAAQGEAGTCQSCHMPRAMGYASSHPRAPLRLDVARHEFSGGNTFLPDILPQFWTGLDTSTLRAGRSRTFEIKRRAARLEAAAGTEGQQTVVLVRVTNLTGHKLPTGFAEGRRMWLHVVGRDAHGAQVFQSGEYRARPAGLIRDAQLKVYEAELGPTAATASYADIPYGPSYHAGLSDSVYRDNRVPPRGFRNAAFAEHRAGPVGYQYDDEQNWDMTRYRMPASVRSVSVRLMFQTVTPEFAEFLRAENVDNPYDWNQWGERVHTAWSEKGAPVVMAEEHVTVQPGPPILNPHSDPELPLRVILAQNYPNPFNASTTIEYWLSARAEVNLVVYDIGGRVVATLRNEQAESGLHSHSFAADRLASGLYLVRLTAAGSSSTLKLLLLK